MKNILVCTGLGLILLTGCQFGDGEDGLEALAQKKRQLHYTAAVALPSLTTDGSVIQDLGPDGLNLTWDADADIAVMGKEFCVKKDTVGEAAWPYPEHLSFHFYRGDTALQSGNLSVLNFSFDAYARHGYSNDYATLVNFLFPYERAVDIEGNALKSRVDSIPFSFMGQNGRLQSLYDNYFVAMGRARAVCTKTNVTLSDSAECRAGHDHQSAASSYVLLDPKMAIVRLSLIVPAQDDFTLLQYLRGLNMSSLGCYVDKIQVSNQAADASGINRTLLNLNTGWMEPLGNAVNYLELTDSDHFWNHAEIARDEAQPLTSIGGAGSSWGTSVYVAVPCTDEGQLDFEPLITVTIMQSGTTPATTMRYYGSTAQVTLVEGGYYVTSPIRLTANKEEVVAAEICKSIAW